MRTVVKHSYVKGRGMRGRMAAHINYIQFRSDSEKRIEKDRETENEKEDRRYRESEPERDERSEKMTVEEPREGKARLFHDQDGNHIRASELKKSIRNLKPNDVTHKLILSPGFNQANIHKYTHEVMTELGRAKGQDLRYAYVVHENTDHKHAHIVLLGRDKENGIVRLDKVDHMRIRAYGDRFLEREHQIERVLDKDMERFARERGLNVMFERERGDEFFKLLGDDKSAKRAWERQEWDILDKNWQDLLQDQHMEAPARLGASTYHLIGRQADLKAIFENNQQLQEWKDTKENNPHLSEEADLKLAELQESRKQIFADIADRTQTSDPWKMLENVHRDFLEQDRQLDTELNPERYHTSQERMNDERRQSDPAGSVHLEFETEIPEPPLELDEVSQDISRMKQELEQLLAGGADDMSAMEKVVPELVGSVRETGNLDLEELQQVEHQLQDPEREQPDLDVDNPDELRQFSDIFADDRLEIEPESPAVFDPEIMLSEHAEVGRTYEDSADTTDWSQWGFEVYVPEESTRDSEREQKREDDRGDLTIGT